LKKGGFLRVTGRKKGGGSGKTSGSGGGTIKRSCRGTEAEGEIPRGRGKTCLIVGDANGMSTFQEIDEGNDVGNV